MPTAIVLLVYALAVTRATRLVTSDRIFEGPRDRFVAWGWRRWRPVVPIEAREDADPPLPVYLITCPWCVSIYLGAIAAPLIWLWGEWPGLLVPALALALSQVVGMLAQIGD